MALADGVAYFSEDRQGLPGALLGLIEHAPVCVYHAKVGKGLAFTAAVSGLAEDRQGLFEAPSGFVKGASIHVGDAEAIQGLGLALPVTDLTEDRQRSLVVLSGLIDSAGFQVGPAEAEVGEGVAFAGAASDLTINVQRLLIGLPGVVVFARREMDIAKSYGRRHNHVQVTAVTGPLVVGSCAFQITLYS